MNVTFDIEQGTYKKRTEAKWVVGENVDWVSYTVNDTSPTMAKYIAYDQMMPPNPFMAVASDGRGNAVFDGGFQKFFNVYAPAAGSSFAQMNASFKMLANAINFCAKAGKPKNVLILGDAPDAPETEYSIKSANNTGFLTSMQRVCAAAGFLPSFLTISDYEGLLNTSLETLEQFSCVILLSTNYTNIPMITKEAIQALVTYREAGNGVIIITGHGVPDVANIAEAVAGNYSAFYRTANVVAAELGVFFSGSYERSPVNVGHIRATFGDHPLFANIANTESIHAGASESRVFIFDFPRYKRNHLKPVAIVQGCYNIQVMAVLLDGTIEFSTFTFCVDPNAIAHVRRLYIRANSTAPWIVNFAKNGWRVYDAEAERFIEMKSSNTLLWDKDNKEWVNVK